MDFLKANTRNMINHISDMASSLGGLVSETSAESIEERMLRRYSTVFINSNNNTKKRLSLQHNQKLEDEYVRNSCDDDEMDETCLSADEVETNKERLVAIADLMSVFADEDNFTSDQDELMNELQDIGFLIAPRNANEVDDATKKEAAQHRMRKERRDRRKGTSIHESAKSDNLLDTNNIQQVSTGTTGQSYNAKFKEDCTINGEVDHYETDVESLSNLQLSASSSCQEGKNRYEARHPLHLKGRGTDTLTTSVEELSPNDSTTLITTPTYKYVDSDTCLMPDDQLPECKIDQRTDARDRSLNFLKASPLPILDKDRTRDFLHLGIPVPKRPISGCIKDLIEERQRSAQKLRQSEKHKYKHNDSEKCKDIIGKNDEAGLEICETAQDLGFYTEAFSIPVVDLRPVLRRYKNGKDSAHTGIGISPDTTEGGKVLAQDFVVTRSSPTYTGDQKTRTVQLTIQYLIVTERLKVTAIKAKNLISRSGSMLPTTFVQLSLMPGKIQKQSSKCVRNSNNPDYLYEIFYFTGISLEDMHLMTLRVQIMQRKHIFRVTKCIGEAYISLENIDLVGETVLERQLLS